MFGWLNLFAHPTLLAGASAGAIPIIIHLLHKQRFKRVYWASMQWLWASQKKAFRRLRIEQLILLLIRILILILLALALARPALQQGLGIFGGQASVHRIIVLDNSFSMGQLIGGKPLFNKAQVMAEELINKLRPGDEADVLLMNMQTEEIPGSSSVKLQEIIQDIKGAQLSDGTTNIPKGVASACKLILTRKSKNIRKEIIIITDRTRAAWETPSGLKKLNSAEEETIKKAFDDPRSRPRIWIARLGIEKKQDNLAAATLEVDEKVVTAKSQTQLLATIQNLGTSPARNVRVTLFVDGEQVGHEKIPLLKPMKPENVLFRHTFMEPGSHELSVSLKPDTLPADNTAFLALDVAKEMKVLAVDGQQRIEKMASELDFLSQALSPTRAEEAQLSRMPLKPHVISDGRFPEENLESYPLIILANVALIPKEKVHALEQFVKRGGCLWIWLGDRTDPAIYNKEFGTLLPATIGAAVGNASADGESLQVSDKAIDHPAIQKFKNIKGLRLNLLHVYRRYPLTPKDDPSVRTVMKLENDEAIAIEFKLGNGRVLLMGTTADKAWCNWPANNQYMPLINFLALDLIRPAYLMRNRTVGEKFIYPIPREELGSIRQHGIHLKAPNGDPVNMDISAELFSAVSGPTKWAGIYRGEIQKDQVRNIQFAANRDITESDLDYIEDSEIKSRIPATEGSPIEGEKVFPEIVTHEDVTFMGEDLKVLKGSLQKNVSGKEIWRWLVGIVFILLLLESFFAKRFGDHTRQ